jgi:hypothetical protein
MPSQMLGTGSVSDFGFFFYFGMFAYIYIYIEREREREREYIYIYTHTHTHTHIYMLRCLGGWQPSLNTKLTYLVYMPMSMEVILYSIFSIPAF